MLGEMKRAENNVNLDIVDLCRELPLLKDLQGSYVKLRELCLPRMNTVSSLPFYSEISIVYLSAATGD